MKKIIIAIVVVVVVCGVGWGAFNRKDALYATGFDSSGQFSREWQIDEGVPGTVEYLSSGGFDDSGCVKISSTEKTSLAVKHKLTGLDQGRLYRFSARMKRDSVKDGRGAVLYLEPREGMEQPWNASEFAYGSGEWSDVYVDFVPDAAGEAVICCGLGFPWGTYNGGKASGTVWYDDVRVTPAPEEAIYAAESKYITLRLDRDKVTVSDAEIGKWLSNLDRVYEAYYDLVGGVPFGGKRLMLLTTPGIEPGYWALAGNPILWNSHVAVSKLLDRTVEFDDWGFGILHEIGHVFNVGNSAWNWNDEIFANFRMSYALEVCDGTMSQRDICYRGADVINYYKIFYDETLGAGIPKMNGDALHYTFLRIKDRYGWGVFKRVFRELNTMDRAAMPELRTPYDKFLYFLSRVSEAAGVDVLEETYTPEELKLIEQAFAEA